MATFLLKTEPDEFSYDDLVRAGREPWTGVTNPAAQKCLRSIRKGDACLIYHTGNEKRIVGLAKVVKGAYPDPAGEGRLLADGSPKLTLIDIAPWKKATTPDDATLGRIKGDDRFDDFALVRQSRLSVMEVPPELDTALRAMAGL